jgi:hypothetical protein
VKLGSSSGFKSIGCVSQGRMLQSVIRKHNQPTQFEAHLSVHYKAQKNKWMDKDIFLDWFIFVFFPAEVKQHLKT